MQDNFGKLLISNDWYVCSIIKVQFMIGRDMGVIIIVLALVAHEVVGSPSMWNQLASFKGKLQQKDYTYSYFETQNSPLYFRSYVMNALSNGRFQFVFLKEDDISEIFFEGTAMQKDNFPLHSQSYSLKAMAHTQLTGTLSYQIGWGITWSFEIEIPQMGVHLNRTQVRYSYLPFVLLIFFGVSGLFIFSISDRGRVKILYNLKRRTHPIVLMVTIIRLLWILTSFLMIGYWSLHELPIWTILILYGLYIFSLSPSIIHMLYLASSAQQGLIQTPSYKEKSANKKSFILLGSIFIFLLTFVLAFAIQKGILFYYILSINTLFIYIYSWKNKKFAYGPLIIYDILLTLTLSLFSLYYPVSNFALVTYKEMLLFWNFYIFLFVFGMLTMKKLIKSERVEEIQLQERSVGEYSNQRRDPETKSPYTMQIIQQ